MESGHGLVRYSSRAAERGKRTGIRRVKTIEEGEDQLNGKRQTAWGKALGVTNRRKDYGG